LLLGRRLRAQNAPRRVRDNRAASVILNRYRIRNMIFVYM
jgi:hypothetical protein